MLCYLSSRFTHREADVSGLEVSESIMGPRSTAIFRHRHTHLESRRIICSVTSHTDDSLVNDAGFMTASSGPFIVVSRKKEVLVLRPLVIGVLLFPLFLRLRKITWRGKMMENASERSSDSYFTILDIPLRRRTRKFLSRGELRARTARMGSNSSSCAGVMALKKNGDGTSLRANARDKHSS